MLSQWVNVCTPVDVTAHPILRSLCFLCVLNGSFRYRCWGASWNYVMTFDVGCRICISIWNKLPLTFICLLLSFRSLLARSHCCSPSFDTFVPIKLCCVLRHHASSIYSFHLVKETRVFINVASFITNSSSYPQYTFWLNEMFILFD